MSLFESTRKLLESEFNTGWLAGSFAAVPIRWDNTSRPESSNPVVFVRVLEGRVVPFALGDITVDNYQGFFEAVIYVPKTEGMGIGKQYSDEAISVMGEKKLTTDEGLIVYVENPLVSRTPGERISEQGDFEVIKLEFPYTREQ